MRPHYVSHAPSTEMGFGCQCGLEPYDGNLSRTVLRGLGASDGPPATRY